MLNKTIRVLYVCPSPTLYGDNIALLNIMPNLVKMGVEPFFLVQREGDFINELKTLGYKYAVCRFVYNNIYSKKNRLVPYFAHAIKSFIWNLGKKQYVEGAILELDDFIPDIIHTNNSANPFGLILSRRLGKPHVWHIREYMDLDHNNGFFPSKAQFEKILESKNNTCIFITPGVSEHYNVSQKKHIIFDGVVHESSEPFQIANKDNVIIFVGRLLETKGVFDVVKAFAVACHDSNDLKLLFLGEGDQFVKTRIKQIATECGIKDKVFILGYKRNVFDYMKKAKAIIVSSRFEAFGFITAEAMYSGCLVIGNNTAGTKLQLDLAKEYCGHEVGFRYNNINSLAGAIRDVATMNDEDMTENLTLAHNCVMKYFTIEKSASKVYELYGEIK